MMKDNKNTLIAFSLIGLIMFVFTWINQPSQEDLKRAAEYQDSIRRAQEAMMVEAQKEQEALELAKQLFAEGDSDSIKMIKAYNKAGEFYQGLIGSEETVTLKNSKVSVVLSSKGAMPKSAVLSEFTDYKGENVALFNDDSSIDFLLPIKGKGSFNTADLYFKVKSVTDSSVVFALPAGDGALEFAYTLGADDYMLDFSINAAGVQNLLDVKSGNIEAVWKSKIKQQEKGRKFENRYAALTYKIYDDDVEELDELSSDVVNEEENVKWIAFKDQFFSSVLIANGKFLSAEMTSDVLSDSTYLKSCAAVMKVPFESNMDFRYYYGPNKYSMLKAYDKGKSGADELDLHRLVPLGWGIFRWVNQFIVIPLFNFFGSFISNYGIIILLLTVVIKLILFPFTYKSYLSTAKMRVLKPQIDQINQTIPEDRPTERQQATFALYSKAGVNPMGGCLPMLLQMPVLIAMFSFFPASIELRKQSFLWADDLSTYDAVLSWNQYIPYISDYFGNHLSLFCLLMTVTNLVYSKVNMNMTNTGAQQQMPIMKYMMYFMPIMFLFIFNDYASGLSYYYLLSLLITIAQTFGMRYFIDEEKLFQKLKENQSKPSKKSAWMERLEAEMKRQQELQREQQSRR